MARLAPAESAAKEKPTPPSWDNDEAVRKVSSDVNFRPAAVLATIQPRLSTLWVTPLGEPVLPEVKKMKAGEEGSGAGRSIVSPSLAIRAYKLALLSSSAP